MDAHQYASGLVFNPPLLPGHVVTLPLEHDRNHHNMAWQVQSNQHSPPSVQGSAPSVHVFSVMNFSHDQRRASGDSTGSFVSSDFNANAHSVLHPSTSGESSLSNPFTPPMDYQMGSFRANIVGSDGSLPMQSNHSMMPWAVHGVPTESFQFQPQHQQHQPSLAFAAHPSLSAPQDPSDNIEAPASERPASVTRRASRDLRYTPYGRRSSPTNTNESEQSSSIASSSHSSGKDSTGRTDINALPPPKLFGEAAYSESGAQKNRKKSKLMNIDRKQICQFADAYPDLKQEEIASYFGVERSTVSKILKYKERWMLWSETDTHIVAKFRPPKFYNLEVQLVKWCLDCKRDKIILTDAMIRAKARDLAPSLGLEPSAFKASAGWLENFKNRRGIRKGVYHGRKNGTEAHLAPPWRPPPDAKFQGETDDEFEPEDGQPAEGPVASEALPMAANAEHDGPESMLTHRDIDEHFNLPINPNQVFQGPNGELAGQPLISKHDELLRGKDPAHQLPHEGIDLDRVTNMDAQIGLEVLLNYMKRDLASYGQPCCSILWQLLEKLRSRASPWAPEPERPGYKEPPLRIRIPNFLAPGTE